MSFFAGLMNTLGDVASARVRAEAQKQAQRRAGRRKDPGCTPCAANEKVMARYNANQQAARGRR